jgi:hypothetical protein
LVAGAPWPVRFCGRAQGILDELVQRCDDLCWT